MTNPIRFTKMQGAGNDYIYINTMNYPVADPSRLSIEWSKPHTGIGSDGLVLIGSSDKADFSMHIYNADGSEAMMCGNASRCIGKYVYEEGLTRKENISIETLSGIKRLRLRVTDGQVTEVTVDMGKPIVGATGIAVEAGGKEYRGTIVSMGNPHFVIFVEKVEEVDLSTVGPLLEWHPLFPDRTNVEFAEIRGRDEIRMRVWERGSGITQACGTGACATAVAAIMNGKTNRAPQVIMDGGSLRISWPDEDSPVYMTGGAAKVFEGYIQP